MSPFVHGKIDDLRHLLDLHDRSVVSVVALSGLVDTTFDLDIRRVADSGDVAYVFVGPRELLQGQFTVEEDGSRTYVLKVPPADPTQKKP